MAKFYAPTKLSENISETPEGFLLCMNVPIARTGWMEYADGEIPLEAGEDGLIHIYRSAEEVFRPETMASFEGKDVTIRHPHEFVSPDNWDYLSKGIAHNVRRANELDDKGEESLLADLIVKDAMTIKLVKAGLREVSCGYEAEYEQTGIGKGIQTNIIGNHIALVEQGRAGATYAINDEKGKVLMMGQKGIEFLKKKFGAKFVDEAMKEDKKEDKSQDAYDELVKATKDLMTRVEGFKINGEANGGGKGISAKDKPAGQDEAKEEPKKEEKAKDEESKKEEPKKESKDEDKEEKEKSEDAEGEMKIEERLKALEAAVSKLLESKDEKKDDEEKSEDDMEASEDEDSEAESEDASSEGEEGEQSQKKAKAGDSKSKTGLEGTKSANSFSTFDSTVEEMTADKMNELNAAHWARK